MIVDLPGVSRINRRRSTRSTGLRHRRAAPGAPVPAVASDDTSTRACPADSAPDRPHGSRRDHVPTARSPSRRLRHHARRRLAGDARSAAAPLMVPPIRRRRLPDTIRSDDRRPPRPAPTVAATTAPIGADASTTVPITDPTDSARHAGPGRPADRRRTAGLRRRTVRAAPARCSSAAAPSRRSIQTGAWSVTVDLRGDGQATWNLLAQQCYQGTQTCPSRQLAIVLDDVIQSAPDRQRAELPRHRADLRAPSPKARCAILARVLNRGAFPVTVDASRVETVSPTARRGLARGGGDRRHVGVVVICCS